MGKVKGEENFPNEVVVNRKRIKRRKELDLLRRNVLEAKKKLDNKTQGFDSKGRRAGLKKICNRLLPSRKPQVGIFANGAKGAEIKRVNLSLNESDRARFEGDLQKVLCDGKRKCKESKSDASNKILHKPSAERIETEAEEFIRIPAEKLERKPLPNFVAERQSGKRKMQVPIELEGVTAKKHHTKTEDAKVVAQCAKIKSEWENRTDKKWKRSLFENEMGDFEPISKLGIEQLRFSQTIDKVKVKIDPSEPTVFPDMTEKTPDTKRLNFNHGQLGRMAAAKYEELCAMVCAENFDSCLQEIPHVDPLKKVKQSLMNFYAEACNQKALRNNVVTSEVFFADKCSNPNSYLVSSNSHKNKYFNEDEYLERSKSDTVNISPPRGIRIGNSKNFPYRETAETFSAQSKPLMKKSVEVKKSENIPRVTLGPLSSGTSIVKYDSCSLDVDYDSRNSFRSDIIEFLKINEDARPSAAELDGTSNPRLAGIPSYRKKTMLRYLKEVNSSEALKKDGSICPLELSAVSAANNDVKKCYLGEPLKRREMRTKQSRNDPKKKLDEMYGRPLFENQGIVEQTRNSLDVNCDTVRTCLGLDLGEFPKIEGRVRPTVVNLGSASRSMLTRVPPDRGEFMLKFLQGVNNPESRIKVAETFLQEDFVVLPESDKPENRYLGDPLRRHQMKEISVNRPGKNERHVPAILRKSHPAKGSKKSNTAGTVLSEGVLKVGNVRWKTSDFSFEKISSESETTPWNNLFEKRQTLRKPPPIASQLSIDSSNFTNPERLDLTNTMLQSSQVSLNDMNEQTLKINCNFMDEIFHSEAEIGQQNIAKLSGSVNFPEEFKPQSPMTCRHKNSVDNGKLSDFHNDRQSRNLPIFMHQKRPDTGIGNVDCENKRVSSSENQDSQRFPVFLTRKATASTQNRMRYEGQYQGPVFPRNGEPKVIIIQNPSLKGIGEDVRREINIPFIPYKNEDRHPQPNSAGLTFSKFPRSMQMALMKPAQLQNGSQKVQPFQAADTSHQNVGQQVEQLQIPRCVCKTELQNEQHVQLPSIMYQNGVQKVLNHKYRMQELGNNPVNFFEPTTFDVPTSQRIFQHDSSSNVEIPPSCRSTYCGNANFENQSNCNPAEPAQLFDRRVSCVLPKYEPDPLYQNTISLPVIRDQISHRQNYSPILSEDKIHNYKYIIDPRCPQAGYKWNQIDQSGAQIHQRVIQPAYNVTDAYRPQVPHTYFYTDS